MSDSSSPDAQGVEQRLETINKKMDEAQSANSSAKNAGRIVTIVVVIAALIGMYLMLSPFYKAYQEKDKYVAAIQTELTERVQPEAQRQITESVQELAPKVWKESLSRAQGRQEDLMAAVDSELSVLMINLQEFTTEELADSTTEVELHLKKRLGDSFPNLQDEAKREVVLGNASTALEGAAKQVVEEELQSHIDSLSNIETMLIQFPIPDSLEQMSDEELSSEMQRALSNYAIIVLRETMDPRTKEVLSELTKEKEGS